VPCFKNSRRGNFNPEFKIFLQLNYDKLTKISSFNFVKYLGHEKVWRAAIPFDNIKTCPVLLFDTQALITDQFQYPAIITRSDYLQSPQVHQILFVFRPTLKLLCQYWGTANICISYNSTYVLLLFWYTTKNYDPCAGIRLLLETTKDCYSPSGN